MPSLFDYSYVSHGARIRAWEAHYLRKGCSPGKARAAADRKRRTSTWPPAA